jgi:protein-S-isoprenylcysteine O-methyltransferase Ste14
VQTARKAVLFAAVIVGVAIFAVTDSWSPAGATLHELIEWAGVVCIVACILGRTWTSLYISGRKIDELVTVGPYSVTRNPLYVFSVVGAGGVGAQAGSIVLALICGALAWIVFLAVVLLEERLLARIHGEHFRAYAESVPRFLPAPAKWRDVAQLSIQPPRVLLTFADALVFLVAAPLAEGFEYLRELGLIPTLMRLP